jgi:hypothetical protein
MQHYLLVAFPIILLAEIKRYVLVFDHMLDLSPHGDSKEDTEVDQKDGPEYWNIKYTEETADKSNKNGLGGRVPKRKYV